MGKRTVFFLSDRTGITVEMLGNSLLSQFDGIDFHRVHIPFLDSEEKLAEAIARIEKAGEIERHPPLVFSTLVESGLRDQLEHSPCHLIDLFEHFIPDLEQELGRPSGRAVGRTHGIGNLAEYERRVDSMHYSLSHDDGAKLTNLGKAEVILIGVSRSGKTPTCLYLSLHYGLFAANYPLIPEDLEQHRLPEALRPHKERLFGLTLQPERLHQIRQARRGGSDYAALDTCRREIRQAESLFAREGIPMINSSSLSIEEIATEILRRLKLKGHR
ncbi:MAG: kinase/pyrophosphorylase [Gammaproteobacteria bacterium SHHR-1]|uniref:posphoenolpyruvate synthetase regulatory kinase/phosphorylase PpsR n=1 Tax=Magnetovirga frankeli TaxID=947516 RepID=UPI001292DE1B|nr:kinase/pyrophosphorylase [gamma proteobacterium SS-5]